MDARETKNIWWYLFGFYDYGERKAWRGWRLFSRRFWSNARCIWEDSAGVYLMRPVCALFGHRKVMNVSYPDEDTLLYCFSCGRYIGKGDTHEQTN